MAPAQHSKTGLAACARPLWAGAPRTTRRCANPPCGRLQRGVTMMELFVVVALIGILTSLALPSYSGYIKTQRIRSGQADLVALVLAMENAHAMSSPNTYPAATLTTADTMVLLPSWKPAQSADFNYLIQRSSGTGYVLGAVGKSTVLTGCDLSIDQSNNKTISIGCGKGAAWL